MTKLSETILASEKPEERRRPNSSYKISFQMQTNSQEEIKKVPVRWKRIYKLRPRQEAQRSTSIHRVHHGRESNQDKKKLVESRKIIRQGCKANYQIVLSIIRALSFRGDLRNAFVITFTNHLPGYAFPTIVFMCGFCLFTVFKGL